VLLPVVTLPLTFRAHDQPGIGPQGDLVLEDEDNLGVLNRYAFLDGRYVEQWRKSLPAAPVHDLQQGEVAINYNLEKAIRQYKCVSTAGDVLMADYQLGITHHFTQELSYTHTSHHGQIIACFPSGKHAVRTRTKR